MVPAAADGRQRRRRSEARLGVVADRVQRRPQRRLPAPQPGHAPERGDELLRVRSHPVHARAGPRVHRLRSLVLVGDGPDLAEPLLPPRGHRRRPQDQPADGAVAAAHDLGADGRPLLDGEELLLEPAALVLAGVPGQELLGRRRADAGDARSLLRRRGARARCPTSRSSIRTSRPTTATRPTISRCARRSSPASTARSPRARSGRARCSWWCSTSTAASSTTSRRR